ncbi:hypothetical protein BHM03_00029786 [Ensete ventricosum]|nr:hypothetical protein BHM03_00029786 [Ensete ventricosum]
MFSGWDFSRSGAIKRVCKFLLKKKLGEVILGDIDLDQLDVQLSTGTIHLSDLALNVDFLNQKVTANCEIEVDELELVLGPFSESNIPPTDADCSPLSHDGQQRTSTNVDKIEPGPSQDHYSSIPVDVHEGVKTIAKIVKWILTSFHVRLKGIIVAFDPRSVAYQVRFVIPYHTGISSSSRYGSPYRSVPPNTDVRGTNPYQRTELNLVCSLHLSIKNFDIYMVKSSVENALDDRICNLDSHIFSAVKILSVKGLTHSGVTLLWQKGPVTGTWMADRAWSLASSRDQNSNKIIGKGSEFSVSSGENLEETSSNIRHELILSSAFLLHIRLSYVWINLDNHDYKFLVCLLNNVIDKCSRESNSMDTSTDMGIKNEQMSLRSSNISQTSILVECNAIDTCIRINELVEVSRPLQKELQGSWSCFKLKIEKFELLSVSNIGGKEDAKLLWLNHGEGDLWGSICSRDEKAFAIRQDLPLITCRNSAMRRGNGEGANALAFGPAGTVVTHIWNPQLHQSYTSIIVRCGTVIAPGGRLDWITAVCLFFSSPPRGAESPEDDAKTQVSFFLDLVDVALSYEPQNKQFQVNSEVPGLDHNFHVEHNKEKDEGYTACLLAAASFSLSVHTKSDPTTNYDIHIKDIGLLISESFGSITDIDGYCISYLQKAQYSKVAQVSLLQAILRIRGIFWEIECEESHIDLESCHDTTSGLFRLIAQLQQLYAPDVEDALIHLQSRWDTVQQTDMDQNTSYLADPVSSNSMDLGSGLSTSNKECQAYGLLDDILENALECHPNSDHCGIQSHVSCEQCKRGDILNVNASRAGDAFAANYADSSCSSGVEAFQNQSDNEKSTPQFIESYYATDMLPSLPLCVGNHSRCEDSRCALDVSFHRDTEYRRGGWYLDDCLTIVEDHISTIMNQPEGKYLRQGELESDNSNSDDCCLLKGRILLKNMDARWRMYAGVDWYKPEAVPTCSVNSNGRDGSLCLELSLVGLYIQYDIYPEGETNVSKLSLSIHDFNLYDRSRDAPWKMVCTFDFVVNILSLVNNSV